MCPAVRYRGHSKLRSHTALGPYGRCMSRSVGLSSGRCVSLISCNPCTVLHGRDTLVQCVVCASFHEEREERATERVTEGERQRERQRESAKESHRESSRRGAYMVGGHVVMKISLPTVWYKGYSKFKTRTAPRMVLCS